MWVWFVWSILAVVLALVSAFFGYTENMQVCVCVCVCVCMLYSIYLYKVYIYIYIYIRW